LQFLLGFLGRVREGENEPNPENQPAHRGPQPLHNTSANETEENEAEKCSIAYSAKATRSLQA
jgi:hypothetical protein